MTKHIGDSNKDKDGDPLCTLCGHYHYGMQVKCDCTVCEGVKECELEQREGSEKYEKA